MQAIDDIRALEWTEERRETHPWRGDILVRRKDVIALLEGKTLTEVREMD